MSVIENGNEIGYLYPMSNMRWAGSAPVATPLVWQRIVSHQPVLAGRPTADT